MSWEEVAATAISGDPIPLTFTADAAVRRAASGDLFAPVLAVEQTLPHPSAE